MSTILPFRIKPAEYNTSDLTNFGSSIYQYTIPGGCPLITNGTISSQQLLNIINNPIQILPPLISGYYTIDRALVQYNFNTTPYTANSGINFFYGTGTTNQQATIGSSSTLMTSSSNAMAYLGNGLANLTIQLTTLQNMGIYMNTDGSQFTSGNGTLNYIVYYHINIIK